MKKHYLLPALALVVLNGCTQSHGMIKANSTSVRADIFEESARGGKAPQGYADLRVSSTLKTHPAGSFSSADKHGTSDYLLLVNIDGQALHLEGDLQKESIETLDPVDPDAGQGIRYRFSKTLRLKAGSHKLVVALAVDGIALEKEIDLREGESNSLVLTPVYGHRRDNRRIYKNATSFKEGIRGFQMVVNGKEI